MWLGSATLVVRLVDLVALVVVLAFVTAADLGAASLAMSILYVVEAVTAGGLGTSYAIIQAETLEDDQRHGVFWYALGVGLVGTVLVAAATPLVSAFYESPLLGTFLWVLCVRLVILSMRIVPVQGLNRALRYRDVAGLQAVASLAAAATRVSVAVTVDGAWALVIAHVVQAALVVIGGFVVSGYRPRATFDWQGVRPLASFGVRATGAEISYQLYRNLDYLLVGRFLGLGAVGAYRVAFDIAMEAAVPIGELVKRTAIPVLSRVWASRDDVAEVFVWTMRSLLLMITPVLVAIFVASPEILTLLAEGQFLSMVDVARVLVAAALMRVVFQLFGPLFMSIGSPGTALRFEALAMVVLAVSLSASLTMLGPRIGVLSASIGWIVAYPILLAAAFFAARRAIGLGLRPLARGLVDPFLGALVVGASLTAARFLLAPFDSAVLRLVALVLTTLVAYAAFLRLWLGIRPGQVRDMASPVSSS